MFLKTILEKIQSLINEDVFNATKMCLVKTIVFQKKTPIIRSFFMQKLVYDKTNNKIEKLTVTQI